jgi:hypothetical protein
LANVGGRCIEAPLIGFHFPSGYGVTESDPVLAPSLSSQPIAGLVFEAEFTIGQWQMLDVFETDAYQQVMAKVTTTSKTCLNSYFYVLNQDDLKALRHETLNAA